MQEILNCVKRRDGARDEDIKQQRFEAYHTIRLFDYAKARGLTLSSEYPYIHDCISCRPPLQATRIFVTSYDSRTLLPDHELKADQVQKQKREVDDIIKGFPVVGLMSLYYPSFKESGEIGQGVYKGKSSIDRYIGEHAVLLTGFDKEEDGTEVFEFKNTSGLAFGAQGFGKLKRDLIFSISYPKGVLKVDKIDKDGIGHKYIMARGLQIHVAEIGAGSSVVLFCYGFPEMWYSWRHVIISQICYFC
ncbi:uncharacterized protein [Coffea arabica]|uniref:Peptidase C1A papain C-terminal domain-containing protein n=1 Tax=Coffea arabica TaxID=13443 RepID=A0A6P6WB66_COFAR|nr:uncharacterized protein LOC113731006 [Coffea arabica]